MKVVAQEGKLNLEEFLSRPLFAHLGTYDGKIPNVSPVWFLWEEREIWIVAHRGMDSFPERVRNHPACSIAIVDLDSRAGRMHHVGFRGRAEEAPWDQDRARRLLAKYLGPDESGWPEHYIRKIYSKITYFLRFTPESAVIKDQSFTFPGSSKVGGQA